MTNTIAILGSTGSIGRQTLDVVRELGLTVAALTANGSVERMEAQVREFRPALAVLTSEAAAARLRRWPAMPSGIAWFLRPAGKRKARDA